VRESSQLSGDRAFQIKRGVIAKTFRHECLVCLRKSKDINVTRAYSDKQNTGVEVRE
jgi:hypothetical protein